MSSIGSCLCGSVSFEVKEFPMDMWKCHCSRCRKTFGGASSAATVVPKELFRWLSGEEKIRVFENDEGLRRRFCEDCGCVVPGLYEAWDVMWIPMGAVDGSPSIKLVRHSYVASKANWEILDDQTEHFPESPF